MNTQSSVPIEKLAEKMDLTYRTPQVKLKGKKLTTNEIYDNRLNLFQLSAVTLFIKEYKKEQKAFPITFIAFKYGEKETVARFFGNNSVLLGKKDIKFYDGRLHLGLIMSVKCSSGTARNIKNRMRADAEFLGMETAVRGSDLDRAFNKIMEDMGNPPLGDITLNKGTRPDSRTESRYRAGSSDKGDKK